MQYIIGFDNYIEEQQSVVAFGKFDGIHKGHQKLVSKVQEISARDGLLSIICTFDMSRQELLMTRTERRRHLNDKVDYLINCPFSDELRTMSAMDFIRNVIHDRLHAKAVVVGADFHFGYKAEGDVNMLRQYADEYGYEPIIIEKESLNGTVISSTFIKKTLKEGNVTLALDMLGYAFETYGVVERGRQLGRKLGFPTMNVTWPDVKIVPPMGVYMSQTLLDGVWYNSISNVGVKPTVVKEKEKIIWVETHLLDYSGNAYEKDVRIKLLEFTRPEKRFESVEELRDQVQKDILYAKNYFKVQG